MKTPTHVDDLEIVGYANVLRANMLPSVVPPVFRRKADPDRTLLPPYSFNAGFVCNAAEVPAAEARELAAEREITLFDTVYPAKPDYELWLDEGFRHHYQPIDEARAALDRIADESIRGAERALKEGNLEEADRLASVAISANDRRVSPLALKAAIRRRRGDEAEARLMARLAAALPEEWLFGKLVDSYIGESRLPPQWAPHSASRRPMHQVAACCPAS